jgi:hypothetical protein
VQYRITPHQTVKYDGPLYGLFFQDAPG